MGLRLPNPLGAHRLLLQLMEQREDDLVFWWEWVLLFEGLDEHAAAYLACIQSILVLLRVV